MKYGLNEAELEFLKKTVIHPLQKNHACVFIFGSRARNDHQKFSDIDLLYIPDPRFPIPSSLLHQIVSELEDSTFPYKVDLVDENELADSYKVNINREKLALE